MTAPEQPKPEGYWTGRADAKAADSWELQALECLKKSELSCVVDLDALSLWVRDRTHAAPEDEKLLAQLAAYIRERSTANPAMRFFTTTRTGQTHGLDIQFCELAAQRLVQEMTPQSFADIADADERLALMRENRLTIRAMMEKYFGEGDFDVLDIDMILPKEQAGQEWARIRGSAYAQGYDIGLDIIQSAERSIGRAVGR